MVKNLLILLTIIPLTFRVSSQVSLPAKDRVKKHVDYLASDSLKGRGEGTPEIIEARNYIINEFKNTGLMPMGDKYGHDFSFKESALRGFSQNIVGWIEGSDPIFKEEFIVIGAHYDHMGWKEKNKEKIIYNGADDNASGVATLIETARLVSNAGVPLKRSVVFIAFGAEESGLIGSENFMKQELIPPSKIRCMFSLDMVGMYSANKGLILNGIKTISGYNEIIGSATKKAPVEIVKLSDKIESRTDTKPFGEQNIPAIHVLTGFKSPYHKPEDDSNLLDYEGMAKIAGFMSELSSILANREIIAPDGVLPSKIAGALQAGYIRANHMYPDKFFDAKPVLGFHAGISAQLKLNKHFALQPELNYSISGSKTEKGTYHYNALTLPLNLKIGIDNNGMTDIYFLGGGYYKYILSGKNGGLKIDYKNEYNSSQAGFTAGFGIDFLRYRVSWINYWALTGLYRDPAREKIIERGFLYSIGIKF